MDEEAEDKQSVSSDLIRGHINTIILRALYDGDKYGYEIISEIERKSHGQYTLKQPSLYSALKRLEKDGFISSYWGGSVSGGRRKYFSLTESGKDLAETNQSEWEYSRTVIDSLISDKAFDFSASKLAAVAASRESASPAPIVRDEEVRAQAQEAVSEVRAELSKKQAKLDEESEKLRKERADFEENAERFEAQRLEIAELEEQFEEKKRRYEREMAARNDAFLREREWREREIAEREKRLEEEKKALEAVGADQSKTETQIRVDEEALARLRSEYESLVQARDEEIERLKTQSEALLQEREHVVDRLNAEFEERMQEREREIVEEQQEIFREREREIMHQNYLKLVSSTQEQETGSDFAYYTAPVGEDSVKDENEPPVLPENDDQSYRHTVSKIFAKAIKEESHRENSERLPIVRREFVTDGKTIGAKSLDGIDFYDLEIKAQQDGIRLYTAGGKSKTQIDEASMSVVHKGKALFIGALILFLFCVALGSIAMGLPAALKLPVFFPYLIWAIGLAVLLIAGIAFANHFGEGSLRRTSPAIINAIVLFVLLSIITLIIALALRIDFNNMGELLTYVLIPIALWFGILLFGIVYYLAVRPKK